MKKLTVIIPTRFRYEKLIRCLDSIDDTYVDKIYVICDGDEQTYRKIDAIANGSLMQLILIEGHHGSVFCRNLITPIVNDGLLYAVDDIEFDKGAIEIAFARFNQTFPDDDGVVGFRQRGVNGTGHPTGVAIMGQKFLQRYPNKQPFFPGYFHFSCQEIHWLAEKLGRFSFEELASLYHHHPAFNSTELDQAHIDARIYKQKDHDLINKRKAMKKIWGNE